MDDHSFRKRKKLIKKTKKGFKNKQEILKKTKEDFFNVYTIQGFDRILTARQPEKQLIVCKTISNFSRPLSFGMRLSKHGISYLLLL